MKIMGIFLAFMLMLILGFFAVGFTDSITAPAAGTEAANQYSNLTQATTIANSGLYATLLIIIAALVFAAVLFMFQALKKRR